MNLTAADVAEIRRESIIFLMALARRYDVSPQTIEAICKGRPWQALADDRTPSLPLS